MAKTTYEERTLAVSLTDCKRYLKVTHSSDDTIITTMIRAAMAFVENFCDASFTDDCDSDDITDFFNNEEIASKWTADGTVSETEHPGCMVIDSGGSDLASLSGIYQRLTGDFDVRVHVKLPGGALAASSGVNLVAKMDDFNGVSARFDNTAGAFTWTRIDEVEDTEYSSTSATVTLQDFYLRIRRSGGRFWVYGKRWNTDAWTEVAAPATILLTSGPIRLWLSAYHGTAFEAWYDWIVENSEYADWPLPWCYGGSASGSGYRLWGECAEPICCIPMWIHPCDGETLEIPYPIQAAIMQMVRRIYDNRGGVQIESTAGWNIVWTTLMASDIARMLDPYRIIGI